MYTLRNRNTDMKLPADAQNPSSPMPNCGLTAMAVAAQCSLAEATEAYQKACKDVRGKRMTGNWKGGTYSVIREKAMTEYLGLSLSRINIRGMSLKKIARYLQPDTMYILTSTGHVQCYMNGIVIDQRGDVPIENYWGKGKRVKEILIVN